MFPLLPITYTNYSFSNLPPASALIASLTLYSEKVKTQLQILAYLQMVCLLGTNRRMKNLLLPSYYSMLIIQRQCHHLYRQEHCQNNSYGKSRS
jgi:hypothetical protein